MDENEKKEMIKKLSSSRENINLLLNMLRREHWNIGHELHLATEAKQYLDETLYELTGDEFYRNKGGENENSVVKTGSPLTV